MIVEQNEIEEWKKLKDHGDITAIAERFGVLRVAIYNAFMEGQCTERVYTALKIFYEEKKSRLQKLPAQ